MARQKHHNLYELEFNDVKITVTEDHPFYFNGNFYSLIRNNKYGIETKLLTTGQSVDFYVEGELKAITLTGMKKINSCEETYTITKLNRNKIFIANGALVAVEEMSLTIAKNE